MPVRGLTKSTIDQVILSMGKRPWGAGSRREDAVAFAQAIAQATLAAQHGVFSTLIIPMCEADINALTHEVWASLPSIPDLIELQSSVRFVRLIEVRLSSKPGVPLSSRTIKALSSAIWRNPTDEEFALDERFTRAVEKRHRIPPPPSTPALPVARKIPAARRHRAANKA